MDGVAAQSEKPLELNVKRCTWLLAGSTVGISVVSYAMHLVTMAADTESIATLDVGDEVSIGTWFGSLLFLLAAAALFLAGRQEPQPSRWLGWKSLAVVMVALSIDEAVSLHERFGNVLEEVVGSGGYLHYVWVVPGMIFTVGVLVGHLGWLRSVRPATRFGMVVGGALFVLGAVGLEIAAGPLAEAQKDGTLALVTLIAIEELLEMAGLTVFTVAVLRHLRGAHDGLLIG
jgi:hypothetical protein